MIGEKKNNFEHVFHTPIRTINNYYLQLFTIAEHREGPSNWVPHYQDIRWSYQSSNEHWFFTMDGGENVPVLSYTAFLPFAYIPEISSLALQLPLDVSCILFVILITFAS